MTILLSVTSSLYQKDLYSFVCKVSVVNLRLEENRGHGFHHRGMKCESGAQIISGAKIFENAQLLLLNAIIHLKQANINWQ
jgi:hypothetical protein